MRYLLSLFGCVSLCLVGCKPSNPAAVTASGLSAGWKEPTALEVAKSLGLEAWEISVPAHFGAGFEIQYGDYDADGKCLGLARSFGGKTDSAKSGTVVYRPLPNNEFGVSFNGTSMTTSRHDFRGAPGGGTCVFRSNTPISNEHEILLFREVTRSENKPGVSASSGSKVKGMFVIRVCPSGTPDESVLVKEIIAGKHQN